MGEPPFLKRKTQFFLHFLDFIKGTIPLCLWADQPEIWRRGSWLIDLQSNGGDRIWRSRRSSFSPRTEPLFWCVFYPDSFDHKLWSRLICGLIEPIFGEHVHDLLIFILNGEDWIWSSEELYFSLRTVVCLERSLHYFYPKLLKLPRLIDLEIWLMYASSFI